ncbi:thiamine pyrophosphate-dependent dehydrogenase E1 component subunit alpha [Pacificispira spongiicola]|uniref:thiamine pyrophosphate-dependent dehydrogenase E1 component subunit alpha n=1 Tax=Pacificispira spongiicola TaxID=2729598 RepID=UPI0029CA4B44|nr:thiamine pyrophosphate-dependent dehydrogenase E1 component subunit alpha [Pacificispira spongiicola]
MTKKAVARRKQNVPPKELLQDLFTTAYKIRNFESEGIKLYRQGLIRGYFHPYLGEEGIATGACAALEDRDYIASTHRGHGHCIARGASIDGMVAELLQKRTGYCKGYGGSMHIADITQNNLGANGIVGAGTPLGVGAALANQVRGSDAVTITFTTDGATNNGTFLEALNLAAIWDLNFILIIENNQYAVSTTIEESTREPDLYKRGLAIGVDSVQIDGNDSLLVYQTVSDAVEKCRAGKGPVLIEAKTFRHSGHHVNDPGKYMPEERLAYYKARDPVDRARENLITMGGMSAEEVRKIEEAIEKEFADAVEAAKNAGEITVEEFREFVSEY